MEQKEAMFTQDDIIKMAHQAGAHSFVLVNAFCIRPDELMKFAELVVADFVERYVPQELLDDLQAERDGLLEALKNATEAIELMGQGGKK